MYQRIRGAGKAAPRTKAFLLLGGLRNGDAADVDIYAQRTRAGHRRDFLGDGLLHSFGDGHDCAAHFDDEVARDLYALVGDDDADALAEKMNAALSGECERMGAAALEKVRPYTIENMARVHQEIFEHRR